MTIGFNGLLMLLLRPFEFLRERSGLVWIAVCVIVSLFATNRVSRAEEQQTKSRRPNLLIILADDMGYGDLGCMGSKLLSTPNIDALRESGVLCSQAYVASPVCSPSRAGLLTGRDPRRFGYQGNLNSGAANYATRPELLGLPPGEHTLGDHLRSAGYATSLIGKWHLGTGEGFHPNDRGFDYFCGMLVGSHSYFPDPNNNRLERNGRPLTEFSSPYLTDFFTDEAIDWMRGQKEGEKGKDPWFMFLSYNAPHGPMHATDEDLEKFNHIQDNKRRVYAAMMLALDRGVGRVRKYLKESGQINNTMICFFSDNGGATGNSSWNGPLSGVKGTLREGGIRVPMIWSWPRGLPAKATYEGVVSSLDLLPTFMAASNADPMPLRQPLSHEDKRNFKRGVERYGAYDGINLLPLLNDEIKSKPRTLFWRLQGQTAIRSGNAKLLKLSHRGPQVFFPESDLGETIDRITEDPDRTAKLFGEMGQWESTLPTVPLWGSSPYWTGQSALQYDNYPVRSEPQ